MTAWLNTTPEMDRLKREIDRAYEDFGVGQWRFPFSRISFLPARAARAYPLINLSEDDEALYAEAMAPGVDPETLNVSVQGAQLTITGEKRPNADVKAEDYHRNERGAGKFIRTIELPAQIDADKVAADYKDGILHVTLPRAESAKPKQVTVNVA